MNITTQPHNIEFDEDHIELVNQIINEPPGWIVENYNTNKDCWDKVDDQALLGFVSIALASSLKSDKPLYPTRTLLIYVMHKKGWALHDILLATVSYGHDKEILGRLGIALILLVKLL